MNKLISRKHQVVRAHLEAAIRSGEFAAGERLPSEQDLAERCGVSYLTARRAVSDLVEADVLERRARQGTYVRGHDLAKPSTTTLNLITSSYEGSFQKAFVSQGIELTGQRGWDSHVIRLSAGQQDPAVRVIRSGEPAIVMLDEIVRDSALGHAMRAMHGKVVSFSRRLMDIGVPSVLNDEGRVFQVAVDYLRAAGHHAAVLVIQYPLEPISSLQLDAWRECLADRFTPDEIEARVLAVHTPMFKSPSHDAYEALRSYLPSKPPETTALFCIGDEITQGALAACRDTGCHVPEDLSLINLGDSPSMAFAHPAVTCVDVDMARQLEIAFALLEDAARGIPPSEDLYLVEPRIVARESLRALSQIV